MTAIKGFLDAVRLPLPEGSEPALMRVRQLNPEIADAIWDTYKTITVRGSLDPTVTELVRLRCARMNGCRLCQSLRLAPAVRDGLDEAMADKVDHYEESDLTPRQKAALRLTDAFLIAPRSIGADVRRELDAWFTEEQILELLLDMVAWIQQKVLIAFALDIPVDLERLTPMDYDSEGNAVLDGVTVE
jgi:AhpD family alkylhydroperoxidase